LFALKVLSISNCGQPVRLMRASQYPAARSAQINPASGGTTRTGGDAAGPV
jgi:hypothetical protein